MSGSIDLSTFDSSIGSSEAKTPEASSDSAKIPELPDATEAPSIAKSAKDLSIDLSAPRKEKPKRKSEEHQHPVKKFKANVDKIVSPVVPQPGAWLKRSNSVNKPKPRPPKSKDEELPLPVFKEKDKQFQYGNYNR